MSAAPKDYTAVAGALTASTNSATPLVDGAVLQHQAVSLLETIARAARDPAVDVEKIERLLALKERTEAKDAERAFHAALRRCQMEMAPINANAQNSQTRSNYADYFALDQAVRPIYGKEGFAVTFSTADAGPDSLKVLGWLLHDDGHSRQYEITMPADGKGAKGHDVMSKTHATGAAMTYGKRYLLADMFNLVIDKDDDGNGAGINNAQVEAIFKLIKETSTDEAAFCAYFKISMVADLSRKDYQRATDYLRRKGGPQKAPDYA